MIAAPPSKEYHRWVVYFVLKGTSMGRGKGQKAAGAWRGLLSKAPVRFSRGKFGPYRSNLVDKQGHK